MKINFLPKVDLLGLKAMRFDDDLSRTCRFPVADQFDHAHMENQVIEGFGGPISGNRENFFLVREGNFRGKMDTVGQVENKTDFKGFPCEMILVGIKGKPGIFFPKI